MKKNLLLCAVLMAAMITSPLAAMNKSPVSVSAENKKPDDGTVSVMLSENGKVEKMDEREYIIGSLAAEMDISCSEEALKAQAVACCTYLHYRKNLKSSDDFNGADISDDPSVCQGYLSLEDRKEKWGENFEKNEKTAEKTVDSILGKIITCNGEPILAAYHELNSGSTESAADVWGKDIPYLQSVESAGDRLSAEYSKTVVLSLSEFLACAIKIDGVSIDDENPVGKIDKTDTGYVKSIEIDGTKVSGDDFRNAFGLNSSNFTVTEDKGKFTIKTVGKGHMVGMSQYGADYMARQGSTYEEILQHYYKNTEIS